MARATPKRKAAAKAVEKSRTVLHGMESSEDEKPSKVVYDSYSDSDGGFNDDEPASEPEEVEEDTMDVPPPSKRRRTGASTSVATSKNPITAPLKTPARRLKAMSRTPATASTSTSKANSISDGFSHNEDGVDTPATAASIRSTRSRGATKGEVGRAEILGEFSSSEEQEILAMRSAAKGKGKAKATSFTATKKSYPRKGKASTMTAAPSIDDDDEDFKAEISDSEVGLSELDIEAEEALEAIFANASGLEDSDDSGEGRAVGRRRDRRVPKVPRAQREREELHSRHPYLKTLWDDLKDYERIKVEKATQPDGLSLTMLPFQLEGLNWLIKQEKTRFNGGILADEMGMGKTIQTIALLMVKPRQKPNLVVAPVVALMQWKSEIEKHTDGALKVRVYHSNEKTDDWKALSKFDVILTTYSVLESGFRRQNNGMKRKGKDGEYYMHKEPSPLHKIKYHRIILDEAHNIKDRSCNTARAVFKLDGKYKLCLSGTPLQNRIGELFSLLRFLEADPFSMYFCRKCDCKSMHWKFSDRRTCDDCHHRPMDHMCWFNYELLRPIQNYGNTGAGKVAFENLQVLLKLIMLRRTKIERADDLGLPPRIVKVRRDYFNEEELDLYDSLYGQSKRQFNTYVAAGVVLNNYANIFTLITRMRQLADHPDLVLRKHSEEGQNNLVCVICDEEAEEAIKSKCHHTFCRMCAQKYLDTFFGEGEPDCPTCHIPLSIDLTQPAMEVDMDLAKKGSIINRIDMANWRSSTKIEALVEELAKLRSKSQTIKSIVFSQFTSMLQLVEWRLRKAGFQTVMLDGSMTPTQRAASIEYFMNNASVEVFLVSLKAGGVALNLVEASQVFIMDPWWNPSVEWQSGDRIHRIGQTRNCKITRLVIEDSIESRIIELQEKKANMINATVGNDQQAMEKLSAGDLQFLFNN